MKITPKTFLLVLLTLLAVVIIYLGVQSVRLKWWVSAETVQLAELTPDQKAADMRYLLDLTRQVSQADAVWQAAGLDNPLDQPEGWIERARQTNSNSKFADLVLQFLVHAGQGGHAFLAYDVQFNPTTSLVGDIPRDAFYKMPQWGQVISRLAWNAHADLQVTYRDGQYVLGADKRLGDITIPNGAVVETVDSLPADEFVLAQQYRAHLRYDPLFKKFFLYPLFSVDPGPARPGWDIVFRLPDGAQQTVFVPKIPGYVSHRPDESSAANTRCLAINAHTLYLKILTFSGAHADQDAATLRQCFASGSFQKVIFDVRGNSGGEIWSYTDNIIAPLIREPLTYETTDPPAHVARVDEIAYPPYSDQGWRVVRVTRRVEPVAEPFPFDGQVYILADNNTLSAGDSFVAVMQRSGLAKVVGANTAGWGQSYQAKLPYALPNSGIIFYLDSELTLNPDGTLNNYVGVVPDISLSASTYPTPYPASLSLTTLLADEWVQWVLHDAP
ncbi:MAG TPA: S41 family peptidase [Levilinea sp.]|nr:S41 family peptidase [Levilinea sp.]